MADDTTPKPGATPDAENPKPDADPTDDIPADVGDKGKEAIRKEREARKAEKARADAADAELAKFRAEKAEADAAKAKADEEEATKKGEFEKLANERAEKLTAATADLKAKDERIAAYEAALKPLVESLKESVGKDGAEWLDGFPEQAEPLDQMTWLNDRAAFKAKVSPADPTKPKFPATPRPNANGQPNIISPIPASRIGG